MRKMPSVTKSKGMSLKAENSGVMLLKLGRGLRGRRLRTRRLAMTRRKRRMNPRIRVAQAKPTAGKRRWSMRGKMTPPILPDVIAIPVAFPRRWRKKCPIEAIHGVLIKHPPIPFNRLYTMKKCQYFVQRPRRNIEAINKMLPENMRTLGPYASKIGPIGAPIQRKVSDSSAELESESKI
jgi:hypothetical protein